MPLTKASPREPRAGFGALLRSSGAARECSGAVPLQQHQFPHPSPGQHSWEVRLQEAWSYKRRGGAGGRGSFLTSPCAQGVKGGGIPFPSSPQPCRAAIPCFAPALLAGGEFLGCDGAGEVLESFFHCSHTHFHLGRTGWAGSVGSWGCSFPWGVAAEQ